MIRKILFPPILLFTAILILGAIVNFIALFSESTQTDSELYVLQIVTTIDKEKLTSPGRVSITVSVEEAEGRFYSAIYVYDPDSKLYTVKEGAISEGFAIFDVWFGWAVKKGNYSIVPVVGLSKHKVVLGDPVFVEVAYGGV